MMAPAKPADLKRSTVIGVVCIGGFGTADLARLTLEKPAPKRGLRC